MDVVETRRGGWMCVRAVTAPSRVNDEGTRQSAPRRSQDGLEGWWW